MSDQNQYVPFKGEIIEQEDNFLLKGDGISFVILKDNTKYINDELHLQMHSSVKITETSQDVPLAADNCNCPPSIRPTGREERIPKFGCETTCVVLVMLCNYCVYNPAGGYVKEEVKVCGACIGLPF